MRLFSKGKTIDVPDWPDPSYLSDLSENELIKLVQCRMGFVADQVGADYTNPYYPVLAAQTEQAIAVILSVKRMRALLEEEEKARLNHLKSVQKNIEEKLAISRQTLQNIFLTALFFMILSASASAFQIYRSYANEALSDQILRQNQLSCGSHQ